MRNSIALKRKSGSRSRSESKCARPPIQSSRETQQSGESADRRLHKNGQRWRDRPYPNTRTAAAISVQELAVESAEQRIGLLESQAARRRASSLAPLL